MKPIKTKVSIIGSGMVGSTVASSILHMDLIAEIALIDVNPKKAFGEAMDLSHMTSFSFLPNVNIHNGTYDDCIDSQIIIITAGPSARPGESVDRMALAGKNIEVAREVLKEVTKRTEDAILIMITNPVDILTYIAQKEFNYPKERIFGSGTVLDTARFRRNIAKNYLVDTENVTGYILGEHGSTAFATWSLTTVGGIPCDRVDEILGGTTPFNKDEIMDEVINIGYEMIMSKGFTNHGIAAAARKIVQSILLNDLSILPVCTTFSGEYGISDVAMSIPCIIGSSGIQRTLEIPLSTDEVEAYRKSAEFIKNIMSKFDI
ncbi:MAG: L-lactate dehydrogenase [Eubacteriales bacterium]